MSTMHEDLTVNTTLCEVVYNYLKEIVMMVWDYFNVYLSLVTEKNIPQLIPVVTAYDRLTDIFYFNEFQILLLKSFLCVFVVTMLLILLSWRMYGERISSRFMKPATSIAIEKLKESVSRLKLPKEHTPRF